jgi:hypothetical protein
MAQKVRFSHRGRAGSSTVPCRDRGIRTGAGASCTAGPEKKTLAYLDFPYVCPEPVLGNKIVLYINGSTLPVSDRFESQCGDEGGAQRHETQHAHAASPACGSTVCLNFSGLCPEPVLANACVCTEKLTHKRRFTAPSSLKRKLVSGAIANVPTPEPATAMPVLVERFLTKYWGMITTQGCHAKQEKSPAMNPCVM